MAEPVEPPSVLKVIAHQLASASSIEEVLNPMLDRVAIVVSAARANLYIVDQERQELYSRTAHLPEISEIRHPIGKGIAGLIAASGKATGSHRHSDQEGLARHQESWIAVPIVSAQTARVVAVLQASARKGMAQFTDADLRLLEQVAPQVAEALAATHLDDSRCAPHRYNKMVGTSTVMLKIYDKIAALSESDASVLITGDAGTGKTLVAQAIHDNSQRCRQAFVLFDCRSGPSSLVQASLLGDASEAGALQKSAGGTLVLQNIDALPFGVQARIAQLIEGRGAGAGRIIAISRYPAENGILHHNLAQVLTTRVAVPSLRERGPDDLAQLAGHWLRIYSERYGRPPLEIDIEALSQLQATPWPANIVGLKHCLHDAVMRCSSEPISVEDLGLSGGEARPSAVPSGLPLADVEERYILRTLAEHNNNRTRTAMALKIGRNTLVRKLKQYNR